MAEENNSNIGATIQAVAAITKEVPVYQDAIQPAAIQVGKSLETVTKVVNLALAPLKVLVWGYEKIEQFIAVNVAERLENVPSNEITTPKSNIVVPALQALTYSGDEPELQDLFANLIAASMDVKTLHYAHPSFVETIKELTPDEAKLMRLFSWQKVLPIITIRQNNKNGKGGIDIEKNFSLLGNQAGCENSELTPVGIDNLIRQGLITIPYGSSYTEKTHYDALKNHQAVKEIKTRIELDSEKEAFIREEVIELTSYGKQFIQVCVIDHRRIKF